MTKILNSIFTKFKTLVVFTVLVGTFAFSILAQAATTIPSETPEFKVDLTVCLEVYNFAQKVADIAAGLTTTKPYDDKGCVRQPDLFVNGTQKVAKYCDFEIAVNVNRNPKSDFCNLNIPVVGITSQNLSVYNPDGSVKISVPSQNRATNRDLKQTFTDNYRCRIYRSFGSNCLNGQGIPRWFSTGVDQLVTNPNGSQKYLGGRCQIQNGIISVRESITGLPNYSPSDYGFDVNNPRTTCAFPDTPTVQDRSLRAYQFVYVVKYPTASECKTWFGYTDSNASECLAFFRNRYGKNLTGNGDSSTSMFIHTHTFFSSWDDGGAPTASSDGSRVISFNFLGWENPDVNKARASQPDALSRSYDGYSTYVF